MIKIFKDNGYYSQYECMNIFNVSLKTWIKIKKHFNLESHSLKENKKNKFYKGNDINKIISSEDIQFVLCYENNTNKKRNSVKVVM